MYEGGDARLEASDLERAVLRGPSTHEVEVEVGPVDGSIGSVVMEFARPLRVPTTQAEAELMADLQQDLLEDLDREFRRADAARTETLLDAYQASMRDLELRYGASFALRDSLGAQAFFQSTGLRLGMSPLQVAHRLDTATTLRSDLPLTWATYLAGESTWRAVDLAVSEAEGLDADRWTSYDTDAAIAVVDAPASRLRAKLRTIRERLQDDTADERARTTRSMRRVVVDAGHDGEASLIVTGPAIPIVGFDQALTKAAIAARLQPGEQRTIGQLRFDIVQDLLVEGIKQSADPSWTGLKVEGRKGVVPAPILTVPALSALGRSTEQARLLGYGPISVETAKEIAGTAKSFIRVLTDPITGVRIDMDRTMRIPPVDMRRWVVIRDELCRFPGCDRPAQLCDIDHVAEWQHAGVAEVDNLVSLSRPHHRAKSAELWQEELRRNGSVDWVDPWGSTFTDPPPNPADPAQPELIERIRSDDGGDVPF